MLLGRADLKMSCQTEGCKLWHFHEMVSVSLFAHDQPRDRLNLIGQIATCSHGLKEEHARFFFQQIILAIDYCHKMKVSNR